MFIPFTIVWSQIASASWLKYKSPRQLRRIYLSVARLTFVVFAIQCVIPESLDSLHAIGVLCSINCLCSVKVGSIHYKKEFGQRRRILVEYDRELCLWLHFGYVGIARFRGVEAGMPVYSLAHAPVVPDAAH